jgi:DNA-binding GntR family transcriptional regulator
MEKRMALHEKIYDSLSNRVYNGQYTFGEKLPSMASLTAEYGVSITTMRAALRRMQQEGLINLAQGREATVTYNEPVSSAHRDYARWLSERKKAIIDVSTMHSFLISDIITQSAVYIDQDALDELESICALVEDDAGMQLSELIGAFYRFMRQIMRASNNDTLLSVYTSVNEFIRIPVLVALEHVQLLNVRRTVLAFMHDMIALIHQQAYFEVNTLVNNVYKQVLETILSVMDTINEAREPGCELLFSWMLRSENKYLYSTIANDLAVKIACGEYADGGLLPSEAQLRLLYGASTISVRRAISLMNAAGIVRTRKGKGTFVTLGKAFCASRQVSADSAKCHVEVLYLMALCLPRVAVLTFNALDDATVLTLADSLRELLLNGGNGHPCVLAKLIHTAISNCPNTVIQYICSQLEAELFMGRLFAYRTIRSGHPEFYSYLCSSMMGLLDALEKRDASSLSRSLFDQLRLIYKFTLDMYSDYGLELDMPPIADLQPH